MSRSRVCLHKASHYLSRPSSSSTCPSREPPAAALFGRRPFRQPFSTSARGQQQEPVRQRYGTANEPPPHLINKGDTKQPSAAPPSAPSAPSQAKVPPETPKQSRNQQDTKPLLKDATAHEEEHQALPPPKSQPPSPSSNRTDPTTELLQTPPPNAFNMPPPSSSTTSADTASTRDLNTLSPPDPSTALAAILRREPDAASSPATTTTTPQQPSPLQPPSSDTTTATTTADEKPPHLEAPPYVHHFDTYTLVSSLQASDTFTSLQSVTLMKAIRTLLAQHMELARAGLVSRSDAEMTAYLTNAASSELRTEISQRRKAGVEAQRAERTQLSHEVEVVSQRITAETAALKDELKGMFDDRKMAARMERRKMENATQELNYRITIALNSEMRQEVEGLRFILTRRTVLALAGIVMMCIGALQAVRLGKARKERFEEMDRKRMEELGAGLPGTGERLDVERGIAAATADGPGAANGRSDAGLVSLG